MAVVAALVSIGLMGLDIVGLALLGNSASAQQGPGDYIFDKIAKDPQVLRRWQRAVPQSFESVDWIYQMQAVTTPVEEVTIDGGLYFLGFLCQPHDCGDNITYFLIASDRAEAAGFLSSVNQKVPGLYFGTDSDALKDALLQHCLKEGDKSFACADAR